MRDSLGVTAFVLDALGRALEITGPDGGKTGYEWGPSGERTGITYPDGRTVRYKYDENLRLKALSEGDSTIGYRYDGAGRLSEKDLPNEVVTKYGYYPDGALKSLEHWNGAGMFEGYCYGYDILGNRTDTEMITGMQGNRSKTWCYLYDGLNRLTCVKEEGVETSCYAYDAFGNRVMSRNGRTGEETLYTYNALNQLLKSGGPEGIREYGYDQRGNMTELRENGSVKKRYEYGAENRLSRAWGANGMEALYHYNGMGMRTGKVERAYGGAESEKETAYILDLTRGFYNLLQKQEGGSTQSYLWDGNVVAALDEEGRHYYCQDLLGSPVRYLDERGNTEEIYRYDEFGCDLSGNQGRLQPFGYTGYQADQVTGTYFAQAREYLPEAGRFGSEDLIKGRISVPNSLNAYSYCWSSPMSLVDLNGKYPQMTQSDANQFMWDWYWGNYWDSAKNYVGQKLQEIVDRVTDLTSATHYLYNEENYGVDKVLDKRKIDGGFSYELKEHTGGSLFLVKFGKFNEFSDFSINTSIPIPFTDGNITFRSSFSASSWNPSTWRIDNSMNRKIDTGDNSTMTLALGITYKNNELYITQGLRGDSGNLPIALPDGVVVDSQTSLRWSLSKESYVNHSREVLVVVEVAATIAAVLCCLVLIADDVSIVGFLDDGVAGGLGLYAINNIVKYYNTISNACSKYYNIIVDFLYKNLNSTNNSCLVN